MNALRARDVKQLKVPFFRFPLALHSFPRERQGSKSGECARCVEQQQQGSTNGLCSQELFVLARAVSATPPSIVIVALVLGGPESVRVVLNSSSKVRLLCRPHLRP
jgi:hypothetical protein